MIKKILGLNKKEMDIFNYSIRPLIIYWISIGIFGTVSYIFKLISDEGLIICLQLMLLSMIISGINLTSMRLSNISKDYSRANNIILKREGISMKRITDTELLKLNLGSKIRIVWLNSSRHDKNEEYYGVVFGNRIGYEDGKVDDIEAIADCMRNDLCIVYLFE